MLFVVIKHGGQSCLMGDIYKDGLRVNKEEEDGDMFVPCCYVMREAVKTGEVRKW